MILFALSLALVCPLPASGVTPPVDRLVQAATDSAVAEARAALQRGQPWLASRLLTAAVSDTGRRTPEVVLLAAEAASRWGGWAEVRDLLKGETWLDERESGAGRALYARALLELGADSAAAAEASKAVASGGGGQERGRRLVIRARALDRLDSLAAAAEAYAGAAKELAGIREWLIFRAAIVTADSTARSARFAGLARPVVTARLPGARADGLLRSGDSLAAAASYAALGDARSAWRIRLALADSDRARRDSLRNELMAVLRGAPGSASASSAVEVLDAGFAPLDPPTELLVARAIADRGPAQRTADAFKRAMSAGLGESSDHFAYGRALAALGQYAQAAAEFRKVRAPRALAASAAYQRARALVRDGQVAAARTALRAVLRDYPKEVEPAATALYLLGDLAADEGRERAAHDAFHSMAARYPSASLAPNAAFRAAIITLVLGHARAAADEFDAIVKRFGSSGEAYAARFWAGQALAAAGDSIDARARWQSAAGRDSAGYYAAQASASLGLAPWVPASTSDSFVPVPDADSAIARVRLLRELGMDREANWELAALTADSSSDPERLLAVANALRGADEASRAMRLTWRALAAGARRDARSWRLLYPVLHRAALIAEARKRGVDPVFAAALIRQESSFTPSAESGAGARGLMQVMPPVGRGLARTMGYPFWDPVLLFEPDVNLELGMAHLGQLQQRYRTPARVLAAYNAGVTRVTRWDDRQGADDPMIFIERIPYAETRDYVRIITRNMDFYRALYDWTPPPPS